MTESQGPLAVATLMREAEVQAAQEAIVPEKTAEAVTAEAMGKVEAGTATAISTSAAVETVVVAMATAEAGSESLHQQSRKPSPPTAPACATIQEAQPSCTSRSAMTHTSP